MREDLIEIREAMELLGYSDERSIKRWCNAHNIPIATLGKKKYLPKHLLTQYIDNQLVTFARGPIATENSEKKYNSDNEIISKYLSKYESASKIKTVRKRPT